MSAKRTVELLWHAFAREKYRFPVTSSQTIDFLPQTNDTGKFRFGNGTYNADLEWYASNTAHVKFDVGATSLTLGGISFVTNAAMTLSSTTTLSGAVTLSGGVTINSAVSLTSAVTPSSTGRVKTKITALAANTTLSTTHFGGVVTNFGATGALVHTIPDGTPALEGESFEFLAVDGNTVRFNINTADTLVAVKATANTDVAADAVIANATNKIVGARFKFVCTQNTWYAHELVDGTMNIIT